MAKQQAYVYGSAARALNAEPVRRIEREPERRPQRRPQPKRKKRLDKVSIILIAVT